MSKSKSDALLVTSIIMLAGLPIIGLLQTPETAHSQTDYNEYLITETNTAQELNQKNVGSGKSGNVNCGANAIGSNLVACPPASETPTPNGQFDTITASTSVPLDACCFGDRGMAEVSCPQGTVVTGGGYEIVGGDETMRGDTNTYVDAPTNNGWKVSIRTAVLGNPGDDISLVVYAVCGALVAPP